MPQAIDRRSWLKRSSLAALGLGLSFPSVTKGESFFDPGNTVNGLINLGSNENPYGISPLARQAIIDMLPLSNRYSFNIPDLKNCKDTIAKYYQASAENILLTAGSGEVLSNSAHFFYKAGGNVVTADPTFFVLPNAVKTAGMTVKAIPVTAEGSLNLAKMLEAIDENTQLVYIVNPNNPTGTVLHPEPLKEFCEAAAKKTNVLIDEAYIDFIDAPDNVSMISLACSNPNVMVTRTFSKIHGMAGLRLGYVVGHRSSISNLEKIYFTESQIAISNLTLAAGLASLKDEQHRQQSKQKNAAARDYTFTALKELKINCIPSHTNFMLFHLGDYDGNFAEYMLKKNIILRSNQYLGEKWCRVSVGTMPEMQQFIKVMKSDWKIS